MKAKLRKLWPGLVGALLASGFGWLLLNTTFGLGIVFLSYDLPFCIRPKLETSEIPQEAVIVYLDDESAGKLNQPLARPWDRDLHAQLLDQLTAVGAKSVTYDIFFSDASPSDKQWQDQLFAEAIKKNGKVILGANPIHVGYDEQSLVKGTAIVPPLDAFAEHAANLASVEQNPDNQDLEIRQHLPYTKDDIVPPLAWAAAELVGAPALKDPRVRTAERWINYYGPPKKLLNYSFWRAISTNANDNPPPAGFFRDKAVFVGGSFVTHLASDRKDEFSTPFWRIRMGQSHDRFMSGVEVHATVFLNLLRGDWLTRTSARTENWTVLLVGVVCGFSFIKLRPSFATALALLSVTGIAVAGYESVTRLLLWFPWTILSFIVIPIAWGWSVLYNTISLYVQKRLLEQTLARYLSPKLVKIFANKPEFLKTGAEKQVVTILFSDIANFSGVSEGMDSDQLAKSVNAYFDRAVPACIFKTDGTVVKFIGDSIFAIWNAPEAQLDHPLRACRGALLLRDQMGGFSFGNSTTTLRTRIGLHTGVANVGNFGSAEKFGYDAMGANINLASRMEGLNKYLGTDVLISGDTAREIAGQLVTRRLGLFRLKGFEKTVEVHELVSELDTASASQEWRELFAKGLECFERKSFEPAEAAFRRTSEIKPDDGPSNFYLERIAELRARAPAGDWTAVIELEEK